MQAVVVSGVGESTIDEQLSAIIPALLPRLYAYARYRLGPQDAEDAVSAALEHLWRNRRKSPKDEGASLEHWAMRVAINKMLDQARWHRRQARLVSLEDAEIAGPNSDRRPELSQLAAALASLGPREADLIALRFGAGLSNPEIAELLHSTPGAIAVAVHRALARLRTGMS